MANFKKAIEIVFSHEGGFSDDKDDPGGPTKYGISLEWLKAHDVDIDCDGNVDGDDTVLLTKDTAIALYREKIWDINMLGKINDDVLATKLFDFAVNAGPKRAAVTAQYVASSLGAEVVAVDGVWGPKTIAALNSLDPVALVDGIANSQARFYRALAARKPSMKKFLRGWLKRAAWPRSEKC